MTGIFVGIIFVFVSLFMFLSEAEHEWASSIHGTSWTKHIDPGYTMQVETLATPCR